MRWSTLVTLMALTIGSAAEAQVHRCTDAAGQTSFSDQPCPSSARSATRVAGADATERRWENEAFGRERNMQSIENASRIIQTPTSDAVGGNAGVINSDPNERIRAQDARNMAAKRAQLQAQEQARSERLARQQAAGAPTPLSGRKGHQFTNCAGAFCYDGRGGSYMRSGGGELLSNYGKACRQRIGGRPGEMDCR